MSAVMANMAAAGTPTQAGSNPKPGGAPAYNTSQGGTAGGGTDGSGGTGSGGTGTTTGTAAATGTGTTTGEEPTKEPPKYPNVSNASSYVGAGLQAGGAMFASPELARGWTQSLAFAPAAVGLVDDMVAEVDTRKALQRAAASALAGGIFLLAAKAIR
ncbi:MAG: hypothetical protein ACJ8AD_09105 [Gemmatimonadaceae bacterium]